MTICAVILDECVLTFRSRTPISGAYKTLTVSGINCTGRATRRMRPCTRVLSGPYVAPTFHAGAQLMKTVRCIILVSLLLVPVLEVDGSRSA